MIVSLYSAQERPKKLAPIKNNNQIWVASQNEDLKKKEEIFHVLNDRK